MTGEHPSTATGRILPGFLPWVPLRITRSSYIPGCKQDEGGSYRCGSPRRARGGDRQGKPQNLPGKDGLIDYMLHRSGHAIGLQVHELPSISATDETIMSPGMCLTIEPALYDFSRTGPSRGAFRIEDLVAITPEGCEVYSQCTTELEIVA